MSAMSRWSSSGIPGPRVLGKMAGAELDDPNDWVRIETAAALRRNILVVPVLVEGARLPDPASLPEELRPSVSTTRLRVERFAMGRLTLENWSKI